MQSAGMCICENQPMEARKGMGVPRAGLQAVVSFNAWVLFTAKPTLQPLWISFCRGRVFDLVAVGFVSGN